MTDLGLSKKRAVVFGAGRGMGIAATMALARSGTRLVCVDIDADRAADIASQAEALDTEAIPLVADVCQRASIEDAIDNAMESLGGIDICIDVVGLSEWSLLVDVTDEEWDRSHELNLRQVFQVFQIVSRRMLSQGTGGTLLSISSVSGLNAASGHGPYGAFKAGLIALTKTWAAELGEAGIRVNCIAPGMIDNPRSRENAEIIASKGLRILADLPPLGRIGDVDDIGKAILFLVSDLASFVSGQTLNVCGAGSVVGPWTVKPVSQP